MEEKLINRFTTTLAAAALAVSAFAATPALAQGLPVPGAGIMTDFPDAHEKPDPALTYKILFDMQHLGATYGDIAPGLKAIGTIINTYEHYGVAPDHLQFQAIFHGDTIALVVDDATYKARTGFDHNPNAELLAQLKKAGVQLDVCGQSAMAQHYDFKSILPLAQMNLSATSTIINLGARGYDRIAE
jgi:intracellular sulfur oxidation DsrE/DsrF family protein